MFLSSIVPPQKRNIFLIGLLVVLTFLVFSPVLKAKFINWNDDKYLANNTNVLDFDLPHIKALLKQRINGAYTPVTSLSFSLEHRLFGLNPFIYHLDNLLLHIAVVVLVFLFAMTLGLNSWEAFLGALIFALHPTKVEPVAWISGRKDLLYALFYMASLVNYQKGKFGASFVFCVLSMLANPAALSLPLVMVLIDWYKGKGVHVKDKWPYFLIAVATAWSAYKAHVPLFLLNITQAPLVGAWSFVFYIKQFFVPLVSIPVYVLPKPISFFSLVYCLALLISIVLIIGVWLKRKTTLLTFAFAFYVLSIFFLLRFNEAGSINVVADRFFYLPSLGLCLLMALGISRFYQFLKTQEPIVRYLFSVAVTTLVLGLMLITYNQNFVWRDTVSLWKHQLQVLPHPVAFNNLAGALRNVNEYQQAENDYRAYMDLMAKGADEHKIAVDKDNLKKVREIIALYKKAIAMDNQYVSAYYNLANLYQDLDRFDDSLVLYNKALAIDSKNKDILFSLGLLYQRMNKPQQSIDTFNRLLKIYPDDEDVYVNITDAYSKAIVNHPGEKEYKEQREEVLSAYEDLSKRKKYTSVDYFNLGFLYEQVGGYEEAIRFYKKALELNPTYEKALYNLANRYQEMGDFKTALGLYQQLIHYHSRFALGYLNMGVVYNSLGDVEHARMLYQKTIDVDPTNAGAYFNLGYLNESAGDLKGALNYYEKAVEYDPQLAEGYYNIGNIYAALGQNAEAIASYLKTVSINKNHQNAFVNLSILSFKSRDFVGAIHYLEEARLLGYNPPIEYLKSLEPYRKK